MKRKMIIWIMVLVMAVMPVIVFAAEKGTVSRPNAPALSFQTTTLAGDAISASILRKYDLTIVDYWAEWCGPCVSEMPYLQQVYRNYPNVLVIGVYVGTNEEKAAAKAKEIGVTYPIVRPADEFGEYVVFSGGGYAIPQAAFFDKYGNQLGQTEVGAFTSSGLIQKVDQLLASLPAEETPTPAQEKPTISKQPKSVKARAGKAVTFTVEARGEGLSYQWYYRTSAAAKWKKIKENARSSSYTLTVDAAIDGYQYRCLVKNEAGKVVSRIAKLKVK